MQWRGAGGAQKRMPQPTEQKPRALEGTEHGSRRSDCRLPMITIAPSSCAKGGLEKLFSILSTATLAAG